MSHSDLLKSNANEMDIRSYLTEGNQISIGFRIPQNPRERKEYRLAEKAYLSLFTLRSYEQGKHSRTQSRWRTSAKRWESPQQP